MLQHGVLILSDIGEREKRVGVEPADLEGVGSAPARVIVMNV